MFSIKSAIVALIAGTTGITSALPIGPEPRANHVDVANHVAAFSSKLTWYYPGLGACGQVHGDNDLVVALDTTTFGNEPNPNTAKNCGRCS